MKYTAISFCDLLVPTLDRPVNPKRQTRRLANLNTHDGAGVAVRYRLGEAGFVETFIGDVTDLPESDPEAWMVVSDGFEKGHRCRYGQAGDRLWVKEALVRTVSGYVAYAAGGPPSSEVVGMPARDGQIVPWTWKPKRLGAMYCPRWAARYTLELTAVRLQRLHDISAADAIAEGITAEPGNTGKWLAPLAQGKRGQVVLMPVDDPRQAYRSLWNLINGPEAWDLNPWVFALSFDLLPQLTTEPVKV